MEMSADLFAWFFSHLRSWRLPPARVLRDVLLPHPLRFGNKGAENPGKFIFRKGPGLFDQVSGGARSVGTPETGFIANVTRRLGGLAPRGLNLDGGALSLVGFHIFLGFNMKLRILKD